MNYKLLAVFLFLFVQLKANHKVHLEIKEVEWNGNLKSLAHKAPWEFDFREKSEVYFLDSIGKIKLFFTVEYVPIFSDLSDAPGFKFTLFDSADRNMDVALFTQYKKGTYDAGIKHKDAAGLRRWAGKLKYTPDTSIHLQRPSWRQDNFTFQIGSLSVWNAKTKGKTPKRKTQKNIDFYAMTGVKSEFRYAGKYGKEKFEICIDPIRYQWGNEVWVEVTVRMYKKTESGENVEVLAHIFSGKDKNILYNGGDAKNNVYEVRDAANKYYMLISRVMLIPY